MGVLTRGDIAKGLTPGVKALFFNQLAKAPAIWPEIAMAIQSDKASETYAWLGDLPVMQEFKDERSVKALAEGGFTIINKLWESTIGVSRSAIEDEQYGQIKPLVESMAEEAQRHKDETVIKLLSAGFSATAYDGVAFFGAHTGGTNSGTAVLSADALQTAKATARRFKGDSGKYLGINLDTLVVGPELEGTALEIAGSPVFINRVGGGTASSGATAATPFANIQQGKWKVVVSPYITETNDWFAIDSSKAMKPFILQNRVDVEFSALDNPENNEMAFLADQYLYGIRARYNAGYGLWQLAYGSTGGS